MGALLDDDVHQFRRLLVSVLFLLSISFSQLATFCQQFIKEMCYVMLR